MLEVDIGAQKDHASSGGLKPHTDLLSSTTRILEI